MLNIHGTPADLRLFAEKMIDATEDPAPESDAQIDAAREDSAYAPGAGDVEVLRG